MLHLRLLISWLCCCQAFCFHFQPSTISSHMMHSPGRISNVRHRHRHSSSIMHSYRHISFMMHKHGHISTNTMLRSASTSASISDGYVDISPSLDGKILKRLVRRARVAPESSGQAQAGDSIEVSWSMQADSGSALMHNSSAYEQKYQKHFSFVLDNEPRQVLKGWEIAVKTMQEGEVAQFVIAPDYAFGSAGSPPTVAPNATVTCELTLQQIIPSVWRSYPTIADGESRREELMERIRSGEFPIDKDSWKDPEENSTEDGADSPLSDLASSTKESKAKSKDKSKFFDPSKHSVDPNLRLQGQGQGHSWEETKDSLDVRILLPGHVQSKSDLTVTISSTFISVHARDPSSSIVLQGKLHGKILPSQSSWAMESDADLYLDEEASSGMVNRQLLMSLEKAHGHRDFWASVFHQEQLQQQQDNDVLCNS